MIFITGIQISIALMARDFEKGLNVLEERQSMTLHVCVKVLLGTCACFRDSGPLMHRLC